MSENTSESLNQFGVADYAVFVFMLAMCSLVGLYFGYKDHVKHKANKLKARRGSETLDYLLGGKNVQVFPVAMSLVSTLVSGITLLGTSTEIYIYGTQYAYILAGPTMMGIFMHYIIIPVFYDLKAVSIFEYLQRRFDLRMRLFGSLISSLATVLWLPVVIYVPALAFNQTTGFDVHIITPAVMAVCIFYTCLGGIKAAVWTSMTQVIMYCVMILISIRGTLNVGGFWVVIERNWNSGRVEAPDFHIDPKIRHSFWTLFIGGTWFWIISNLNQNVVQRFLSLKSTNKARKTLKVYVVAATVLVSLCIFNGLLLYATFHDCDPLTTKLAKAKDQLVPLLMMQVFNDWPGLPGLFIAGLFSASLSSISSALSSMSAVVLEDYFKPCFSNGLSERACVFIMRGTVIAIGCLTVALVYIIEKLGPVLQLSMTIPGTCVGSLFGVFIIGMFLPWIGKRAAFYGALTASAIMIYFVAVAELDMAAGLIKYDKKITSVEGCDYNFTLAEKSSIKTAYEDLDQKFHHVSYLYYLPMGVLITCISAFIFSFLIGFDDPENVDPRLLAPFMRKYFKSNVVETFIDSDGRNAKIAVKYEMEDNQIQ